MFHHFRRLSFAFHTDTWPCWGRALLSLGHSKAWRKAKNNPIWKSRKFSWRNGPVNLHEGHVNLFCGYVTMKLRKQFPALNGLKSHQLIRFWSTSGPHHHWAKLLHWSAAALFWEGEKIPTMFVPYRGKTIFFKQTVPQEESSETTTSHTHQTWYHKTCLVFCSLLFLIVAAWGADNSQRPEIMEITCHWKNPI
jgi:hypothetical protein